PLSSVLVEFGDQPLSLLVALPISELAVVIEEFGRRLLPGPYLPTVLTSAVVASLPDEPSLGELLSAFVDGATGALVRSEGLTAIDRKSTRLNSSHVKISYAVFCLK